MRWLGRSAIVWLTVGCTLGMVVSYAMLNGVSRCWMNMFAGLPPCHAAFSMACAATLDQILADCTATDAFSGAVQVAWHGRPLVSRAVGLANRDFAIPNTPTTKFNMGSLGKMITAVAVAQL